MEAVLHAGGWTVEAVWLDLDGSGERGWHRVVAPDGAEHWCTTSGLQRALAEHGLSVSDLTYRGSDE
jgi:hypothetical protein